MLVRSIEDARKYRSSMNGALTHIEDGAAAKTPELFEVWEVDVEYKKDARMRYNDLLYKVTSTHTSQADWTPDITPALYTVIDVEHEGTLEDPIPAVINMEYFEGKYYSEGENIYLCIRDSGIPLADLPSQLVGQYFELVEV